jgi:very-short-patch-repair endonuclease
MTPRPVRGKTSSRTVLAARQLRNQLTKSEQILWEALRNSRLHGIKFRRQHPFGPYVLDFFCVKAQLAVELDGGVHDQAEQKDYDQERTAYLEAQGIRVLRLKNEEITNDFGDVLRKILEFALPTPTPPSPDNLSGEGGDAAGGGG